MKGAWTLLAALMIVGCQGDGADRSEPSGDELPARTGPARPPAAHIEGNYALADVAGRPLPATLEQSGDCRVEVLDAALRMEAGRFAFQNRVREVCGQQAREPVMHAAGGTYSLVGSELSLMSDVGTAFSGARATADSVQLTVRELSTDAGAQSVSWTFRRQDGQLVPLPGSTEPGSRSNQ